jgi:hypothetical protein
MPRGPKGEKRPADVIGNAVRVRPHIRDRGFLLMDETLVLASSFGGIAPRLNLGTWQTT